MKTTKDLAWLGGLLEGEAAFMIRNGSPVIRLQMTDRDTMDRAAAILGVPVGKFSRQPKGKATYRPVWHLGVHGTNAICWMMTLYQFLGERRQAKIRYILDLWKASNAAPRAPRGQRYMAVCHPHRPRRGNMLCGACYMRQWRQLTGRTATYYRQLAALA